MWVLIFICLNGAQGCTYSAPPNIRIGAPSCDYECVVAYKTRAACQQDADAFKAIYDDPDIFEVCREVK